GGGMRGRGARGRRLSDDGQAEGTGDPDPAVGAGRTVADLRDARGGMDDEPAAAALEHATGATGPERAVARHARGAGDRALEELRAPGAAAWSQQAEAEPGVDPEALRGAGQA